MSVIVPVPVSDVLGTGTITDNDGAPDVQIGDVTVDEGAGTATFAVTLSNPSASDITLTLDNSRRFSHSGTITRDDEFGDNRCGATSGTFSVAVLDDAIDENDETFSVSVQSVDAGTVGSTSDTGTGTITDNDGAPDVQIGDVTVDEGAGTARSL